jgi:hypothetical protein
MAFARLSPIDAINAHDGDLTFFETEFVRRIFTASPADAAASRPTWGLSPAAARQAVSDAG